MSEKSRRVTNEILKIIMANLNNCNFSGYDILYLLNEMEAILIEEYEDNDATK